MASRALTTKETARVLNVIRQMDREDVLMTVKGDKIVDWVQEKFNDFPEEDQVWLATGTVNLFLNGR